MGDAINEANNYSHMAQSINSQILEENNNAATVYHDSLNNLRGQVKQQISGDITTAGERAARLGQVSHTYMQSAPMRARISGKASAVDTNAPQGQELEPMGEHAGSGIADEGAAADAGAEEGAEVLGTAEGIGSKVAKYGLKGAVIGMAGLDLAEDIAGGGVQGANWEEKTANIGNIVGGVLEGAGMVIPVFAPELELAAGIVSIGSSILGDIGDMVEDKDKKAQAKKDLTTTTQQFITPSSTIVQKGLVAKPMTE